MSSLVLCDFLELGAADLSDLDGMRVAEPCQAVAFLIIDTTAGGVLMMKVMRP
jgi:hypothetical protein